MVDADHQVGPFMAWVRPAAAVAALSGAVGTISMLLSRNGPPLVVALLIGVELVVGVGAPASLLPSRAPGLGRCISGFLLSAAAAAAGAGSSVAPPWGRVVLAAATVLGIVMATVATLLRAETTLSRPRNRF